MEGEDREGAGRYCDGLSIGVSGRFLCELVSGIGNCIGKRWNQRRCFRKRRSSGRTKENATMEHANYGLCSAIVGWIGSDWLVRCLERDSTQLDWKVTRSIHFIWCSKFCTSNWGLYHSCRYHFWSVLYGFGSWTWIGEWIDQWCPKRRNRSICEICRFPFWKRTNDRSEEGKRSFYRCICQTSIHRRANSDLDWRLCIGRLWNGCGNGCSFRRSERLGFCQAFWLGDSSRNWRTKCWGRSRR